MLVIRERDTMARDIEDQGNVMTPNSHSVTQNKQTKAEQNL